MIQRIQTIYLFLVFLFALFFIIFPKGAIDTGEMIYEIKTWNIISTESGEKLDYSSFLGTVSMVLPFIIMVLTIYSTFVFKKRLLQIKLGKINIFIHLLLIVSTFFYLDALKDHFTGQFSYGVGVIFPLISMILILLANRAIRRDENLVRSADRLR